MTSQLAVYKPTTKCCGLLSVRFLSALMCAVLIITTTTAALGVTFHFSIIATNNFAKTHTIAITDKAKSDVENFLNHPVSFVVGMQYMFSKGLRPLPRDKESQDPLWYQGYWDTFVTAMRGSNFKYNFIGMGFEDGNRISCEMDNDEKFQCELTNWGNRSLSKNGSSTRLIHLFNRSDFSFVGEKFSSTLYDPRTRPWYTQVPHKQGKIAWTPVYPVTPQMTTISLTTMIFNETGIMLGVLFITIPILDIGRVTNDIVTTPGSVSVIIDNEDVLLSSSLSIPFQNVHNISTSYNETIPRNCFKRTLGLDSILLCRETISSYPYLPMRELKSSYPEIINEGTNGDSQVMTIDGIDYFITVARIVTPMADAMGWRIILFLPVEDFIIGIIEARNLACHISVAIIIFAVIVSFLNVRLLLKPLNALVEDMYRVSSMQDMDENLSDAASDSTGVNNTTTNGSISILSEIASIQFAFNAMRAELTKIKSFLPQSLLALYEGGEFSDEGEVDKESRVSDENPQQCNSDDGSECTYSRSVQCRGGKRNITLNTALSVSHRSVTVISLNIAGYHATLSTKDISKITHIQSALVTAISSACTEHRGVMNSFQGDRFLVSFNAVTSVGNHAVQAAHAALTACRATVNMSTPLMMTAGLASGSALVGNMGSTKIKHFAILGHVVSTATTLERLAKRYRTEGGVLVGGSAVTDVENFFDVLTVDAAVLPISSPGSAWRARIAAVMSPKVTSADEWMYELEKGSEKCFYRDANLAFEAFLEGNLSEAISIVKQVLDGKHDPDSTSTGEALNELMCREPPVDGKRYVSPMTDFYIQCVLPKWGTAATNMSYAIKSPLTSINSDMVTSHCSLGIPTPSLSPCRSWK